jgi:hypothetical protein
MSLSIFDAAATVSSIPAATVSLPPPLPPYRPVAPVFSIPAAPLATAQAIVSETPHSASASTPPPPPPPPPAPMARAGQSPAKLSSNPQGMLNQIGGVALKPVIQAAPTTSDLLSQLKQGVPLKKATIEPKVAAEDVESEFLKAFKAKFKNVRPADEDSESEDDAFKP